MSNTAQRLPLARARLIAEDLAQLLAPACERVEIAGSIRRGRPDVGARFWSKVQQSDGCWRWTGAHVSDGYGSFRVGDRSVGAHVVAYVLSGQRVPDGLEVMHRCDVRDCVRPDHLTVGTHLDNVRDMHVKGRALKATGDKNGSRAHPDRRPRGEHHPSHLHPECMPRGERNGNSRLTSVQVQEIRSRYRAGGVFLRELAVEYGACWRTIQGIVAGTTRRDG